MNTEIQTFLACPTPESWVEHALTQEAILLIDHANCEKKAATTALNLIHCYPSQHELLQKMARLAREELLHLQKVTQILKARNITYRTLSAGRYARLLRQEVRSDEPGRLVDLLITGALIEARSCERFAAISPHLDAILSKFYDSLYQAEKRHFEDYLKLAIKASSSSIDDRVAFFVALEGDLINQPDNVFRFHSGVPR